MKTYDINPIIILPGINHSPTFLYDNNGKAVFNKKGRQIGGTLFFVKSNKLKTKYVPSLIKSFLISILTKSGEEVKKASYELAQEMFRYQECDNNGNHIANLKTLHLDSLADMDRDRLEWAYRMVPMKPLVELVGKDKIFFYTFNLVGDPLKSAEGLDEYIDEVLLKTGKDKVTLMPVSLGGTILTSYLDLYGYSKVGRITSVVGCLDGSDIVADMMERNFNTSDEYLRHRFLAEAFNEISGDSTGGYLVNIILNSLPREVFNSFYTGFMSGILDTVMIKCPQIWAMIPSHRYEGIAERYLNFESRLELKKKADRFQQARLNLRNNLLSAHKAGVKFDAISGSNLSFGEVEYSFFGAVGSSNNLNTDGIISLKSTTLDAYGALPGTTLGESYKQAKSIKGHKGYSYISPDNKIDVSTALFPDNTWIFLNQHHEVGNNDAVLNLVKDIILEKVIDVHSDPINYPQFNYSSRTKELRRWTLNEGIKLYEENGELLTDEDKTELNNLIIRGKNIITGTIGNAEEAKNVKEAIDRMTVKYGLTTPPKNRSEISKKIESVLEDISMKKAIK